MKNFHFFCHKRDPGMGPIWYYTQNVLNKVLLFMKLTATFFTIVNKEQGTIFINSFPRYDFKHGHKKPLLYFFSFEWLIEHTQSNYPKSCLTNLASKFMFQVITTKFISWNKFCQMVAKSCGIYIIWIKQHLRKTEFIRGHMCTILYIYNIYI